MNVCIYMYMYSVYRNDVSVHAIKPYSGNASRAPLCSPRYSLSRRLAETQYRSGRFGEEKTTCSCRDSNPISSSCSLLITPNAPFRLHTRAHTHTHTHTYTHEFLDAKNILNNLKYNYLWTNITVATDHKKCFSAFVIQNKPLFSLASFQ
jgi:hypothetical protein